MTTIDQSEASIQVTWSCWRLANRSEGGGTLGQSGGGTWADVRRWQGARIWGQTLSLAEVTFTHAWLPPSLSTGGDYDGCDKDHDCNNQSFARIKWHEATPPMTHLFWDLCFHLNDGHVQHEGGENVRDDGQGREETDTWTDLEKNFYFKVIFNLYCKSYKKKVYLKYFNKCQVFYF